MFPGLAGGFQTDIAGGNAEAHGTVQLPADLFGMDTQPEFLEEPGQDLVVAGAEIGKFAVVQNLCAASDGNDQAILFGAELTGSADERRHAGIDEQGRLPDGPHCVGVRVRKHQMAQSANPGDRIIESDSKAGSEGVGGHGDGTIVRHRKLGDAHDDFLFSAAHGLARFQV